MFRLLERGQRLPTLETAFVYRDGHRTVTGPLGTVSYDEHGNATFIGTLPAAVAPSREAEDDGSSWTRLAA